MVRQIFSRRRFFWTGILLAMVVFGIAYFVSTGSKPSNSPGANKQETPAASTIDKQTATPSNEKLIKTISNDDNPAGMTYQIVSVSQPSPGWFIVNVKAANGYGSFDQIALVQQSVSGELDVIAGPATSFQKSYLTLQRVPSAVANKLPVASQ